MYLSKFTDVIKKIDYRTDKVKSSTSSKKSSFVTSLLNDKIRPETFLFHWI
jgi:hypothetical protein